MKRSVKILALICCIAMILNFNISAQTVSQHDTYQKPVDPSLIDPAELKFIQEKDRLAMEYYQAKISGKTELATSIMQESLALESDMLKDNKTESDKAATSLTTSQIQQVASSPSKYISMTWYQQPNEYYCGPATAKMIITRKTYEPFMMTLAGLLGTTTAGTAWYIGSGTSFGINLYPMASTLNNYSLGRTYIPKPWPGISTLNENSLKSSFVYAIDANAAIAFNTIIRKSSSCQLLGYDNSFLNKGHWYTADGYASYGDRIRVVDPYGGKIPTVSSRYYMSTSTIFALTNNGSGGKGIIY